MQKCMKDRRETKVGIAELPRIGYEIRTLSIRQV